MAFSNSIIGVLAEEGYQWSIVASHHLIRTCPTYMNQGSISNNRRIFSSLPNKADQLGPSPSIGWWYGQPNPGNADFPGCRLSNPGMTIYAALRGTTLYVATWAPGASGNDHFIMIGDSVLTSPVTAPPWAKAGLTALPAGSPFLAAESSNAYIGWFNANGATTTARAAGQQMEGILDIAAAFGTVPGDLYLASLAYQTNDAGLLGTQAPTGNSDGNVDPVELLRIPVEALRDDDANGTYDRLEPGKSFVITQPARAGNTFALSWKCFPGRSYKIQSWSDLMGTSWADVSGVLVTAGSADLSANCELPISPTDAKRFFRVVLVP